MSYEDYYEPSEAEILRNKIIRLQTQLSEVKEKYKELKVGAQ